MTWRRGTYTARLYITGLGPLAVHAKGVISSDGVWAIGHGFVWRRQVGRKFIVMHIPSGGVLLQTRTMRQARELFDAFEGLCNLRGATSPKWTVPKKYAPACRALRRRAAQTED